MRQRLLRARQAAHGDFFWIPMMSLFGAAGSLFSRTRYPDVRDCILKEFETDDFRAFKMHGPYDGKWVAGDCETPVLWVYNETKGVWLSDHPCRRRCECQQPETCSFHFRYTLCQSACVTNRAVASSLLYTSFSPLDLPLTVCIYEHV
jgi:hypothetical protein